MVEDYAQYMYRFRKETDCEDIRFKELVKQRLIKNKYIIHALNQPMLDEDSPGDFMNKYILPYYLIMPTQMSINNYICFETQFTELARYNDTIKVQQLIFYILCNNKNIIDTQTGIARHDEIAALITEEFNWTNCFGHTIHLVSNQARAIDHDFVCRTLIFETETLNGISKNGKVINNGRN